MTEQIHWATDLIGVPYGAGAAGPDAFDCWGLVRYVFRTVHGIDMPVVSVGRVGDESADNVAAIKRAAEVSGWKPSSATDAAENDIVLMNSPLGRHVGVMVRANGALLFLHAIEGLGVCVQPLADLSRMGFTGFTFWRRGA